LVAPLPLLALAILVANDRWWKPHHVLPSWATGKISDFAGLLFFPLLLTAAADAIVWLIVRTTGAELDFALRRWKLALACGVTAAIFTAIKLSPSAAAALDATLRAIGFARAHTVADASDLIALVSLAGAWWLGVREIASKM
jgi:hypothetical protein